jgi:hypothetical protein
MKRLALETTRPQDLPFVYGKLRELHAPRAVHSDDGELVTGWFPLPVTADGNSVALTRVSGRDAEAARPVETRTLDWTSCLDLEVAWVKQVADKSALLPALMPLTELALKGRFVRSACHVAIIASCEGEAVVLSHWMFSHLAEFEAIVGRPIETISWLASDIAPVGHFKDGNLTFDAIDAETWVLATLSVRLRYCETTSMLRRSLQFADKAWFEFALDLPDSNVTRFARSGGRTRVSAEACRFLPLPQFEPRKLVGGAFRDELLAAIARNAEPTPAQFSGPRPTSDPGVTP